MIAVQKRRLSDLLHAVMNDSLLIAPVKRKDVRFEKIDDPGEVFLDENSLFPLKKFFFGKDEELFRFDKKGFKESLPAYQKKVFFAVRRCDLNAVYHQDIAFLEEEKDPYYERKRNSSIFIGLHCKQGDEYCFCNSLKLIDFHDLMFYDKGDEFLVEVGSERGHDFVKHYKMFFKETDHQITEDDRQTSNDKLLENDIAQFYDHPEWENGSKLCLSCGACNFLCPTCFCFEIKDWNKNLEEGKRLRQWSGCQIKDFTRVAGNHIFRDSRLERFKHRIYHQLQYFKDKHGITLCTGCGRCIRGCPKRIDFIEIINKLE